MAALDDWLARGPCKFFEDEGIARGGGIDSKVVGLLEPDYVRGGDGCFGDGDLNYGLVLPAAYEQDLFYEVFRAVTLDERHDEILFGFWRGVSYGHPGAFAKMGVVPDI